MTVLVAYGSRLGSTADIANRLAARLRVNGVAAIALQVGQVSDPSGYDAVVIGSAVYAGHWLPETMEFVRLHATALSGRPSWLFSSGPVGDRAARAPAVESADVRTIEQLVGPIEHRSFAGALDRQTVDNASFGRAERFIAQHLVPEGDWRDWAAIDAWADGISRELTGMLSHA
jgi:menaquinone-dependent protoporphyrinogen oxidase